MPRNGSGTYSLPEPPFVAGTVISSSAMNDDLSDIATALTDSLPRNGEAGMLGQFQAVDGSILLPSMSFSNDANTGFYSAAADEIGVVCGGVQVGLFTSNGLQNGLQVGMVFDYAGSSVPSAFLLCYGQNVNRVTYAALFAAIGTTYGSGDGVTTFGLPDLRGRLIYGKDNMGGSAASRLTTTYYGTDPTVLGNAGGGQSKTLLTANLPAYTPAGSIVSNSSTVLNFNAGFNQPTGAPNVVGVGGTASGGQLVSGTTAITTTTSTFTGTAQGGTSDPLSAVNPGLIMNKIIYAGV